MRKCPKCDVPLTRVDYEGFPVMHCAECKGYLVPLDRLESIKRAPRTSQEQLKEEASSEFAGDHSGSIRCPRCHAPMEKERVDNPVLTLYLDRCEQCRLVWLDGGELALVQLAYETSREFLNAEELRQRLRELEASPERKAQFEADLARLPDAPDPMSEALGEGMEMLLWSLVRHIPPRSP